MPFIENNEKFLRRAFAWAAPFYGVVTDVRNFLFDKGLLKSYVPDLPVINVGNLCAGGSGKTPMVEYLVRLLLNDSFLSGSLRSPDIERTETQLMPRGAALKNSVRSAAEVANVRSTLGVVTRGYGRSIKGSFEAKIGMDAAQIGDEPVQYLDSFAEAASQRRFALYLAAERKTGIEALQQRYPNLRACILDDAFQHRRVDAGLNILMSDFHKPFFKDRLLPRGDLREARRGSRRAQIVVFSKCPDNLSVQDKEEFLFRAGLKPYQKAFFTCIKYGDFVSVTNEAKVCANGAGQPKNIFLFTGIANPQPLEDHLKRQGYEVLVHRRYGDHHAYTENEVKLLLSLYHKLCERQGPVLLLTTQKDFCRLKNTPVFDYFCTDEGVRTKVRTTLAYVPIRTEFLFDQEAEFKNLITNFVNPR